jgi:hypothetical protein
MSRPMAGAARVILVEREAAADAVQRRLPALRVLVQSLVAPAGEVITAHPLYIPLVIPYRKYTGVG